ncbi:Protein png1 [Recurvomyces mirabilis]|nr:Protein png1 [Recurvomyces mirabilis]
MADRSGVPRRKPVPPPQPLPEGWAADLTIAFRRKLSTKRMNELSRRPSSQRRSSSRLPTDFFTDSRQPPPLPSRHGYDATPQQPQMPSRQAPAAPFSPPPPPPSQQLPAALPSPPAYNSLKNLPTVPVPPTDTKSLRFRSMLMSLSNTPCKWENPGLLDEALGAIPLQRIYDMAQEESDLFTAEAASLGPNIKPAWGYQDCVVRALMKWFKREFFEWVNNPLCSTCRTRTLACGMAAPLPDEQARGANRVELYQCANQQCGSFERFPRYNDAFVLLQTRRGRCGEWANCFTMLCRAVGSRVRWVWNAEDHVWTEVYSVHRKRWVHVDCCEEQWDAPLLYTQGWGKKLSYCIAFSADGCCDVTRRYARNPAEHAAQRNRSSEGVLSHIVREITALRRRDMDKKEKFRLNADDMREDAELRKVIIEALAFNVSRILPGGDGGGSPPADPDAQKAAEGGRQSGAMEWVRSRGEGGRGQFTPGPGPRDPRQQ